MTTPHTPALVKARTVLCELMHHKSRISNDSDPLGAALDAARAVASSLSICLKLGAPLTLARCDNPEIRAVAKETFEIALDCSKIALEAFAATEPAARRAPVQRTACDPARRARLAALTSQYNQIYK